MTLMQYCEKHRNDMLLTEWDWSRNENSSPEEISSASHHVVWWQCRRGHIWKCAVKERTGRHTGCPYCTGRRPIPGETDLASQHPDIAAEWHPKRNGALKPQEVTSGSEQKVWWQCRLGHEWQATVENRALKGNQCPYCTGRKAWPGYNDLATLYPELMKEWHPKLNSSLDPSKIRPGARKRVYWRCSEGHVWDTWIFSRTSKKHPGCPVCAKRIKTAAEAGMQKDCSCVRSAETAGGSAEYTQTDNLQIPAAAPGQESRYQS